MSNQAGIDLLSDAMQTIRERGDIYGAAVVNMRRIATMWEVILGFPVMPQDVAACMIAVKLARLANTPNHKDSVLDIAGYAAVLRECQEI